MNLPNTARAAAVLAGSTIALVVAAGAPAGAATTATDFPDVPTTAGGGLCVTSIRSWADTNPDWPGRAVLNIQAAPAVGLGPGPYPLAPMCELRATVSWHNTDTGATGSYATDVLASMHGSIQYSLFQDTGPGHIQVTVDTDRPCIPARGSFDVPGRLGR